MAPRFLGEFEQMVLLAILRLGEESYAVPVLRELDARAGHSVSRGTLYKTLERLHARGLVAWTVEEGTPERGGHPRRRFRVTALGMRTLHDSRSVFLRMWEGLEGAGEGSTR